MTGTRPRQWAVVLLGLVLIATQQQAWAEPNAPDVVKSPGTGTGETSAVASAAARSARLGFLYFLASHNDYTRLSAEIAQLKAEDPSWTPPKDLFDAATSNRIG